MSKKVRRWFYGKEYGLNAPYHDFFGNFDLYQFSSKKRRDEWVSRSPYSGGFGRMRASGNDYATDLGEHENRMLRYLMSYTVR